MTDANFRPTLYVKQGCPFSFKTLLFVLEAGLIDRFEVREFAQGSDEEAAIRAEIEPHLEKVSFPAVQYAPGQYQTESDDIIARYAREANVDPAQLPVLNIYLNGVFKRVGQLFRENMELKKQLEPAE
jgi:hypothetical protein